MQVPKRGTRCQRVLEYIGNRFEFFSLIGCVLAAIVIMKG